jgi:TonB family protein
MGPIGHFSRFLLFAVVFLVSSVAVKADQLPEGARLIKKVEPVFPDAARRAHISGTVVAQVTISTKGEVTDLRPMRGDSMLNDAVIDAVWQWQYSPSYLSGEAVPATATVTVIFTADSEFPISIDRVGTLRHRVSGLEGDSLIRQLVQQTKTNPDIEVVLTHDQAVPFRVLEEKLRLLQSQGIQKVAASGPYIFHGGRLFCLVPGVAEEPQLAINAKRLSNIVRASGRQPTVIVPNSEGVPTLLYRLFLSESGEVISVQRLRGLRGPEISEIQAELARTAVVKPARIGSDPVPAAVRIEIPVRGIGIAVRNTVPAPERLSLQSTQNR